MKNLTYVLTTIILFCGLIYLSCGGGDRPGDAHRTGTEIDQPIRNTRPQASDTSRMQTDGMLGTKPDCPNPNTGWDKELNNKFCTNEDCLIDFAGYRWWTNYHFIGRDKGYYWSEYQGQAFSPRLGFIGNDGYLHLQVKKEDLGGGPEWMAGEVVAVYKQGGKTPAGMGYGTYLVTAKMISGSPDFGSLDRNVALGLFTYQQQREDALANPYRELDLAEISKWGAPPNSNVLDPRLLVGNAQFAVQLWDKNPANVQRYTINNVKEATWVMVWSGGGQPVKFMQFDGAYNINNFPQYDAAQNKYTTTAAQNNFIPSDGCQRFHMNLWMGNYGSAEQINKHHPGPSNGQTHDVAITNFQYTTQILR